MKSDDFIVNPSIIQSFQLLFLSCAMIYNMIEMEITIIIPYCVWYFYLFFTVFYSFCSSTDALTLLTDLFCGLVSKWTSLCMFFSLIPASLIGL